MDKATLLAEVISQVKKLKKNAAEASKGLLIPMDADEVRVEPYNNRTGDGRVSFKATICASNRSELLSDIRQALDVLHLKMDRTEISTLGDRVKIIFVFSCYKEENSNGEKCQILASSVHGALSSVLDKACALAEYSPRTTQPSKRRRISYFDSSSSSSWFDHVSVDPENLHIVVLYMLCMYIIYLYVCVCIHGCVELPTNCDTYGMFAVLQRHFFFVQKIYRYFLLLMVWWTCLEWVQNSLAVYELWIINRMQRLSYVIMDFNFRDHIFWFLFRLFVSCVIIMIQNNIIFRSNII